MELRKITEELSVSPQISAQDVEAIKAAGFRSIICNRPDGEAGDQPLFVELAVAAHNAGMQSRMVPVETGKVTDDDARAFTKAMADLPKPVLAFCRSGTRSATLWSLAEAGHRPLPQILSLTARPQARPRYCYQRAGRYALPRLDAGWRGRLLQRADRQVHGVASPRASRGSRRPLQPLSPTRTRVVLEGCRVVLDVGAVA